MAYFNQSRKSLYEDAITFFCIADFFNGLLGREAAMLSVVIPALNEQDSVEDTINAVRKTLSDAGIHHEIVLVNDGSSDRTGEIATECGVQVVRHPRPGGYGKSLKDGILHARGELIAITDADGTYPIHKLVDLYELATNGYDMVVGARSGKAYRGSFVKSQSRRVFLWLSHYATGEKIDDINSGFRIFRRDVVIEHIGRIGNGFSFTTTITLIFFLNGYYVTYLPIDYYKRTGSSHVRMVRDSLRSLQIIVESIIFYNPLKIFLLPAACLLLTSISACAVYFLVDDPKIGVFTGLLSTLSLVGSFVIAVIGFAATIAKLHATK
jgi:glycosyltransferase involved in cell wall biosynthesis